MEEEDSLDVNAWLGKPPEQATSKATSKATSEAHDVEGAHSAATSPSPSVSSHESDLIEIPHRPAPAQEVVSDEETVVEVDQDALQDEAQEEVDGFVVNRQENLTINIPELPEAERDEFDYLPDHFTAKRILYALPNRQYIVKLGSGEIDLVSST